MSKRRYARGAPKPGDDPEPEEKAVHRGRRKHSPVPSSMFEQPLQHFSQKEISSRVDAALAHFARMREAVEHPENVRNCAQIESQARERVERGKAQLPPSDRE